MIRKMLTCLLVLFWALPTKAGSQEEYDQLIAEGQALMDEIDALTDANQTLADELKTKALEVRRVEFLTNFLDNLNEHYAEFGEINQETLDALREASEAHVAWIQNFRALIRQWRPDWPNIVDLETYKTAYSRIAMLKRDTPDDKSVLAKESNVRTLLTKRSDKIQEIIGRLAYLNGNEKLEALLTDRDASSLLEKTIRIKRGLFDMLAQVTRPVILMTIQQQIRRKLLIDVPRKWHRMLASVMQRIIQENAIELTDQFLRSMNDPVLYYDAKQKIFQSGTKISNLLFEDYCPRLAQRQLKIHKVLLQDIEENLPTLPVTEPMREHIQAEINGGWNAYYSNKDMLDYLADEDKQFMHEYRVSRVENVLSNLRPTVAQLCTQKGQYLIDWEYKTGRSTFDHEKKYKEFMVQCAAN